MEARFYREILPRLPINAPRCLYAGDDPERQQHLVILEDLNPRGARFCRVQNPLDFRQAAAFLDIIARYTAQWWDSEELARLKLWHWDPLPDDEMGVYQWGQLQPDVWSRFVALPRGTALPKFLHDREQMQRALLRLKAFDRQGPMCFLHGDFHLGNLYHEADGTPGVLDWQCYCTGPWSHDVTYFLVSALDIADRRRWDRALIAHFLERLSELGVAPPSFDEAWDAYRRQIVDGLYFWLVNPPEFQSEENNCAVAPRFAAAAVDHDTFELMA
jgi:aminoglycoside/choline kinase family phosphotransferase